MKRNVTIQTEEERTLEAVWVLRGYKRINYSDSMFYETRIRGTREFDELPSDNEIAQFIHDTKSGYVKLEHIFRLCECDIPFN